MGRGLSLRMDEDVLGVETPLGVAGGVVFFFMHMLSFV